MPILIKKRVDINTKRNFENNNADISKTKAEDAYGQAVTDLLREEGISSSYETAILRKSLYKIMKELSIEDEEFMEYYQKVEDAKKTVKEEIRVSENH